MAAPTTLALVGESPRGAARSILGIYHKRGETLSGRPTYVAAGDEKKGHGVGEDCGGDRDLERPAHVRL